MARIAAGWFTEPFWAAIAGCSLYGPAPFWCGFFYFKGNQEGFQTDIKLSCEELQKRVQEWEALEVGRKEIAAASERFFNLSTDIFCIGNIDGYLKQLKKAFEKTMDH